MSEFQKSLQFWSCTLIVHESRLQVWIRNTFKHAVHVWQSLHTAAALCISEQQGQVERFCHKARTAAQKRASCRTFAKSTAHFDGRYGKFRCFYPLGHFFGNLSPTYWVEKFERVFFKKKHVFGQLTNSLFHNRNMKS